ncbi:MAG: hypothetical protein ACI90V_001082, partial [Bacillariaceae sp.]
MNTSKTNNVSDPSTPRLTCDFISRSEFTDVETVTVAGKDGSVRKAFLFQETGKKSSYVLQQQEEEEEDST